MTRQYARILGPILGLLVLGVAIFVLYHKLSTFTLTDLERELRRIPTHKVVLALVLTALYYTLVTAYDTLSLKFIGHPLRYRRIALASFAGYAFSHNVGCAFLSSGSVRYRVYSSFGLTVKEIAKVVMVSVLSFWIGFLAVTSAIFLVLPMRVPAMLHLPFHSVKIIGYCGLALLIVYGWYTTHATHGHKIRGVSLPRFTPKIFALQLLIGSLDWLLSCAIVFVLLPDQTMSFPHLFEIFILAQISGLASQVPGGIGVFDGVLALFLKRTMGMSSILGLLLVYRLIFYILPLLVATVLLATHEVRIAKNKTSSRKWLSL